jgi:hypothetical protein
MEDKIMEKNYADTITLDSGKVVRVTAMDPNAYVKIHGRSIRVGDIPMSVGTLNCGCIMRGIAISLNNVFFCEKHKDNSYVVEIVK